MHIADVGQTENAMNLSPEDLKKRKVGASGFRLRFMCLLP